VADRPDVAPAVSICIPAHSRPEYLRQAIDSVLRQTFADLELIVSDDAGDAEDVVRSFDDGRVRYSAAPRNRGMARNWEAALALSRGKYVGLLMDDDRLLPGYVATLHAVLEAHPDVGIAFANHYFDDDGAVTPRAELIAPGIHRDMLLTLLRHNPVPICSTLIRRSVMLELVPLPDTDAADIVMMARAALSGVAFYYVTEPLMVYRRHAGQLSGQQGFKDQVAGVWDEFDFPADSEFERTRREQPMWSREGASPINLDEWLAGDVGHLHRAHDLTSVPLRSTRAGGRAASLLERALRRLLLPVLEAQTSLNGANARVASLLLHRLASQGQAIDALEQQVGELRRERRA
jgi:glycosyl transferase family 2